MNTLEILQQDEFFETNNLAVMNSYYCDTNIREGLIRPKANFGCNGCSLSWRFGISETEKDKIYKSAPDEIEKTYNYYLVKSFKNRILEDIENYFNKIELYNNKEYPLQKDLLPKMFFDDKSIFEFGKHKGKSLSNFSVHNWSYLNWCLCNIKDFIIHKDFFFINENGYVNGGSELVGKNSEKIKEMYAYKSISMIGLENINNKPIISEYDFPVKADF